MGDSNMQQKIIDALKNIIKKKIEVCSKEDIEAIGHVRRKSRCYRILIQIFTK